MYKPEEGRLNANPVRYQLTADHLRHRFGIWFLTAVLMCAGCWRSEKSKEVVSDLNQVTSNTATVNSGPNEVHATLKEATTDKNIEPPRSAERLKLSSVLEEARQIGTRKVAASLRKEFAAGPNWNSFKQTVTALERAAEITEQHPDQLWFQMQARTRLVGWESLQEELLKVIPSETLIALTSNLDPAVPGIRQTWRFGHRWIVYLAFSTDGRVLYAGTENGDLMLIDTATWAVQPRHLEVGRVLRVLDSPDGDALLSIGWGRKDVQPANPRMNEMGLYLIKDGRPLLQSISFGRVGFLAGLIDDEFIPVLTPNGQELVAPGTTTTAYRISDQKPLHQFIPKTNVDTRAKAFACWWRNQGKRLCVLDSQGVVRSFDYPAGEEAEPPTRMITNSGYFLAWALAPDGERVAMGHYQYADKGKFQNEQVTVLNLKTREESGSFKTEGQGLKAVAFLGADRVAAATQIGEVLIWKKTDQQPSVRMKPQETPLIQLVGNTDGTFLAICDTQGYVRLLDPDVPIVRPRPRAPAPVTLALSPQGDRRIILTAPGVVALQEVATSRTMQEIDLNTRARFKNIRSVILRGPDDPILVSTDGAFGIWNIEKNLLQVFLTPMTPNTAPIQARAATDPPCYLSATGKFAVTWHGTLLAVFDTTTGKEVARLENKYRGFENQPGFQHAFLADDRLLVDYWGYLPSRKRIRGVTLIDLATGKKISDFFEGDTLTGWAFARDRNLLVASGKLNETSTENALFTQGIEPSKIEQIPFPKDQLAVIGITHDGERLLVRGSERGQIFVWDFPQLKVIRRFDLGIQLHSAEFDGLTLRVLEFKGTEVMETHTFEYHRGN
ncbi:MAG: hypothetical protein JWM11_7437 [Planctomycetaceae bacterium]|nr:hypothetical protein [Planctomycetaceae bacterium]